MKYIYLLFVLLSGFTVTKCITDLDENCKKEIYPCLNYFKKFNVTDSASYCEEQFYTKKCQDLFSYGIESINSCNLSEEELYNKNQWIFDKSVLFRFLCSVDEHGKRCPIINLWDKIYGEDNKKMPEIKVNNLIYETIIETCKTSEKCSNEFIGFTISISQIMAKFNIKKRNNEGDIPNFKNIDLEMMNTAASYFQSSECQNNTQNNGTISIKFNSKLYIILFSILFLFL